MSRNVYVGIKLKSGETVIASGCGNIVDCYKEFNYWVNFIQFKKLSPTAWYKYEDLDSATIRVITGKRKNIRKEYVVKVYE